MKVLYAIQATGNGHISRAEVLIPLFKKFAEVDLLVSGTAADIELDHPVRYKFKGLSFVFGKKGGVDVWKTLRKMNLLRFFKDVKSLNLNRYDLIINDFEPISAWASLLKKKQAIALSHQYSLLSNKVPKPIKKAFIAKLILKYYAPTKGGYGFHFKNYEKNIFTPIIKNDFINQQQVEKNHYVVYLPSFGDEKIISVLQKIVFTNWFVFSKHSNKAYTRGNISVLPLDKKQFNHKLLSAKGVICGAGFETPSEALYLKKKLLVIPMKNQYEQLCNAEALKEIGVPVVYEFNQQSIVLLRSWVKSKTHVEVDYSDHPLKVVHDIFSAFNRSLIIEDKSVTYKQKQLV